MPNINTQKIDSTISFLRRYRPTFEYSFSAEGITLNFKTQSFTGSITFDERHDDPSVMLQPVIDDKDFDPMTAMHCYWQRGDVEPLIEDWIEAGMPIYADVPSPKCPPLKLW